MHLYSKEEMVFLLEIAETFERVNATPCTFSEVTVSVLQRAQELIRNDEVIECMQLLTVTPFTYDAYEIGLVILDHLIFRCRGATASITLE